MHLYKIKAGTKCKLLTQEPDKDVTVRDYVTRKNLDFVDEQVVIDFVRLKNEKIPPTTQALKLAASGYSIFCNESANDKYLVAVHLSLVEVL